MLQHSMVNQVFDSIIAGSSFFIHLALRVDCLQLHCCWSSSYSK